MKKLITLACTFAIAATMVVSVSATGSFPDPEDIEYWGPPLNTGNNNSTNIPVYGYVGEDADMEDTDPGDPNVKPEPNPIGTDMEISLPVKIMWAAFASDGGAITSPEYTIENKSAFAVDVQLTSFTNTTPTEDQNAAIEDGITISLTDLNAGAIDVAGSNTPLPLSAGTLTASNGAAPTKTFNIGGNYVGSFATEYEPTYSMVLTFSIH